MESADSRGWKGHQLGLVVVAPGILGSAELPQRQEGLESKVPGVAAQRGLKTMQLSAGIHYGAPAVGQALPGRIQ